MIIQRTTPLTLFAAALVGAVTTIVPAMASAQDAALLQLPDFIMPQGCALIVTVQQSDCSASVHYSCAGSAPGTRYIATTYPEGLAYLTTVDATYTWVDRFDAVNGTYEETVFPVGDPIDTNNLMTNGIDAFAMTQVDRSSGVASHYTGYDWMTGTETMIDGVRLLETTFHVRALGDDGAIIWEAEGTEYLDPELGLFHQGRAWYDGNADEVWASSPMEFVFPDEPGASQYLPTYGCE